jgi:LCP family protein required for cell wall assembly
MFQVPRDMVDVPVPSNARSVWGSVYRGKINSWYTANRNRSDLWPGKTANARGFNSLKALLGELYGLDIRYYALVNFQGFRKVVNAMGGVNINVQIPVAESQYPVSPGVLTRIYIPAGPQHMTGAEALRYARSRHRAQGGDFDRGRRQQRVLLSLREQMNAQAIIANLPELVGALKTRSRPTSRRRTCPSCSPLAEGVDTKNIRSFVFSPFYYAAEPKGDSRGYIITPNLTRIRRAVDRAFKITPELLARRERLESEGAERVGLQRDVARRAADVDGGVPRVPGPQRVGAAAVDRHPSRQDEDRRLQRQGDGPAGDDQVPRAAVRHRRSPPRSTRPAASTS